MTDLHLFAVLIFAVLTFFFCYIARLFYLEDDMKNFMGSGAFAIAFATLTYFVASL